MSRYCNRAVGLGRRPGRSVQIITVLREYYQTLGATIHTFGPTPISIEGDGAIDPVKQIMENFTGAAGVAVGQRTPALSDLDLCYLPATEALRRFAAKTLSPLELLDALIARAGCPPHWHQRTACRGPTQP
jgi:hypothetical protein